MDYIACLKARNFRSYRVLDLEFDQRFVVFYGLNGAGKSNILEAISIFMASKGMRRCAMDHLTHHGCRLAEVEIECVWRDVRHFLCVKIADGKRQHMLDGSAVSGLQSLRKYFWQTWITPDMSNFFIESPGHRRNFFDALISAIDLQYAENLKHLLYVNKERLRVTDPVWLSSLEEQCSTLSVALTLRRVEYINHLRKILRDMVDVEVELDCPIWSSLQTMSEEDVILQLQEYLLCSRIRDVFKQQNSIGAHRACWELKYQGRSIVLSSRGEQKITLIMLVLASLKFYRQCYPNKHSILLLDDIMTYLDEGVREYLVRSLLELNVQTFCTGTDRDFFESVQRYHSSASFFMVKDSVCYQQ